MVTSALLSAVTTASRPTILGLTGSNRDAAFLGGGPLGADYQFAPNWVVGIEGQISGLSNSDRTFTVGASTSPRSLATGSLRSLAASATPGVLA